MNIEQAIVQVINGMLPSLVFMCLVFGALGACLNNIVFAFMERKFQKYAIERRAKNWKARQDLAKAEQSTHASGDGVGGRACETPSDSAA